MCYRGRRFGTVFHNLILASDRSLTALAEHYVRPTITGVERREIPPIGKFGVDEEAR